jgi:hypothetical protein
MSVVARDGRKQVVGRGTAFAEVIQYYLSKPATKGDKAADGGAETHRVRGALAFVGRLTCELEFRELAAALGLQSKGAACRRVQEVGAAIAECCEELGYERGDLFGTRPEPREEADDADDSAAERSPRGGSRRSDWIRGMKREH